ncbi:MAG TPA: DJ-1/PfpI family protein [Candidatus Binatia bacterium]|jgi:transcriptional regulator GlxA family with amidase domain|nr:DJ-1/PfpI family protein [Candidatus Binatia bacterium]
MTDSARTLGVVLFPDFELLDVFGPVEMFGNLTGMVDVVMVAHEAGPVRSAQGPRVVADHGIADCPPLDLLLVPGGAGTRDAIRDTALLDWLRTRVATAEVAMTVCTGTELFAEAGLLDGKRATTNKMLFTRLEAEWPKVHWVREARWVEEGKLVTSSGVSAGIDMALAVIAKLVGPHASDTLASLTEYEWHRDAAWDPFAKVHGLV